MKPTEEQAHAVDLFLDGGNLAIEAGAGTGKTSTLRLLADATDDHGQYVAFNKSIVEESKGKFPSWVKCNTAHSLAYRAVMVRNDAYKARLHNSKRTPIWEVADLLEFDRHDEFEFTTPRGETKVFNANRLAGHTLRSLTRFCQTADEEPGPQHVPYIPGIDRKEDEVWINGRRTEIGPNNRRVRKIVSEALEDAWEGVIEPEGKIPFRHEHYLKIWQLGNPKIEADFILFDEAQDANPVMRSIVDAQTHAQRVWVGDSQQQIYSWMGAVNALASVPAEQRAFLTQSFRFGPKIAKKANEVLERLDADLRIKGLDTIPSIVGVVDAPNACLARTNAGAVGALLNEVKVGRRPHLVGGGNEIAKFMRGLKDLEVSGKTSHPDLWMFSHPDEVTQYAKNEEDGEDLKMLVTLVESFGVNSILNALDNMPSEERADVVISTAHKAKGREWNTVALLDDFPTPDEDRPLTPEEYRLLYVACTRARYSLDVNRVPVLNGMDIGLLPEEV